VRREIREDDPVHVRVRSAAAVHHDGLELDRLVPRSPVVVETDEDLLAVVELAGMNRERGAVQAEVEERAPLPTRRHPSVEGDVLTFTDDARTRSPAAIADWTLGVVVGHRSPFGPRRRFLGCYRHVDAET
jgi:hypothetical protein